MLDTVLQFLTLDHLIEFFKVQIATNQFSQGAIVAAIAAGIIAWGKAIPGKIFGFLKRCSTITMRYNSDSPDYEAISRYVTQEIIRDTFSRNFVFQTETAFDREEWTDTVKHRGLTAGYGTHFGLYKGWPVLVDRHVEESSNTKEFKEHTVVTFLTRSKKRVYAFSQEIAKAAGTNVDTFETVPVHINNGGWWQKMGKLPLRRLDSVFTSGDSGQKVIDTIRDFESKKEEHRRLGLPHHMGIMLHGEPGCGKSSLIHAVASETERSIYYLNLGSVESDKELTGLLSGTRDWSRTILAIEDIDAAGVKVDRGKSEPEEGKKKKKKKDREPSSEEKSPISLSALLNVLDGILCPDGLVVIATTNHHTDLDPALTRAGRFDHTVELGKLGRTDFERMAHMFGRNPDDFAVANDVEMTGADMRALILEAA